MDNYGQTACLKTNKETDRQQNKHFGPWHIVTRVGNEITQTVDCCLDGNGSLYFKRLCNGIVRLDRTPQTTLLLACGTT